MSNIPDNIKKMWEQAANKPIKQTPGTKSTVREPEKDPKTGKTLQ